MRCSRWIAALVVLAVSCGPPEAPDEWSVERVTPSDQVAVTDDPVCEDVRSLALGPLGSDPDLHETVDELARISALVGATAALPRLERVRSIDDDVDLSGAARRIERHDALAEAGGAIDAATMPVCDIPAFSAFYAASGFPACHFEMEIPVGAYTAVEETGRCVAEGRPAFLPCWSADGDHLPVDCVTGEIVRADGDRWVPAGPPQPVVIDRTVPEPPPTAPTGPPVIAATHAPACAGLEGLFLAAELANAAGLPNGNVPDYMRLAAASLTLDADIRDLIVRFVEANTSAPDFDEFEVLVAELDRATAEQCGLPIVSAWVSITEPVEDLPCWSETGNPYPAYEQTACA